MPLCVYLLSGDRLDASQGQRERLGGYVGVGLESDGQ